MKHIYMRYAIKINRFFPRIFFSFHFHFHFVSVFWFAIHVEKFVQFSLTLYSFLLFTPFYLSHYLWVSIILSFFLLLLVFLIFKKHRKFVRRICVLHMSKTKNKICDFRFDMFQVSERRWERFSSVLCLSYLFIIVAFFPSRLSIKMNNWYWFEWF